MRTARAAADGYLAGFNDRDMDLVLDTFNPAGFAISPEGAAEGHDELASYIRQLWDTFSDLRAVVWNSMDIGDLAVDEFTFVGTQDGPFLVPNGHVIPPTGRPIRVPGCILCTVENGLIVSVRLYFDQLQLITQLGYRFGVGD
ncbi:SnoaL-like domain-containing protein [Sinosporangium album]|uniref:SnoaL-like domain-containing protein n=1 Tax=Sinosporangium album TaxID=504805 RepID=A0A1G8IGF6_9ACTN|nr:nuclear transport factor 2 family protein [Sinosporangium album]SDI18118.1 SnoaL-like domain-containing protein [Sinosporangium album]